MARAGCSSLSICHRRTLLSVGLLLALGLTAPAHPVYMDHVEHQVQLLLGPANIDVTIELRFNEVQSLTERRRMDIDRDGAISPAERDGYLRRIATQVTDAFKLTWADRPLELIPLYEPQIDLLGIQGVSPNHHVLKLSYFARTPADLVTSQAEAGPAGRELIFEDRSWPSAPALWLFSATGQDGINVTVTSFNNTGSQPSPSTVPSAPPSLVGRCRVANGHRPIAAASQPAPSAGTANETTSLGAPATRTRNGRSSRGVILAVVAVGVLLARRSRKQKQGVSF